MNGIETALATLAGPLGWALVHSLWQGALVALVYAALRSGIAAERAAARYRLAAAALAALLLLPLATGLRPGAVAPPAAGAEPPVAVPVAVPFVEAPAVAARGAASAAASPERPASELLPRRVDLRWRIEPFLPWISAAWLAGVALLSALHLVGLGGALRLRTRGTTTAPAPWPATVEGLARRLGVRRGVALLQSTAARVPSVVGWLRPAIVVPASAFVGLHPAHLEALLAHELAHVRRGDYLANLLQTLVETLLFFHPATWWISGEMRREREHCCDDLAVELCGDRRVYARALAGIAELRLAGRGLALAADGGAGAGSLLARVRRLFAAPSAARSADEARPSELWIAGVLVLALVTAGIGAASALVGAADAVAEPSSAAAAAAEPAVGGDDADSDDAGLGDDVGLGDDAGPSDEAGLGDDAGLSDDDGWRDSDVERSWRGRLRGDRAELEIRVDGPGRHDHHSSFEVARSELEGDLASTFSLRRDAGVLAFEGGFDGERGHGRFTFSGDPAYREAMSRLGWRVPEEELFQAALFDMKVEWASELASLGYGAAALSWDDLVAYAIHDVTPAFVRELSGLTRGRPSADELLAFRIHDVDPDSLRELERLGFGPVDADEALAMKIHGVDAEALAALRAAGLEVDDLDQAVAFRIHGVSAEFIQEMRSLDLGPLDGDDVLAFRIHGVTPEFVRGLREEGVRGLDADALVALRVHDVDLETVRDLHARGFTDLDADDLVDYAIHGRRWARAAPRG